MPRTKVVGKCTVCGEEKPLFDVKNQICGSCAGRKGGRPPKSMVKPPRDPPEEDSHKNESTAGTPEYRCDACDAPVRYGQHKCGKCGTWIDWRGSPVENDPNLVICPECGAICGHSDQEVGKCPHCNYGG